MKSVRDILREADPVHDEPGLGEAERDRIRQAVVAAASEVRTASAAWFRGPLAVLVAMAVIVIGILAVGSRNGPQGSATVYAAVRFELRLAEDLPGPGLREARASGSDRAVYLHDEVLASNEDIAGGRVIPGNGPTHFNIAVRFNESAAERMRQATANHIGRPIAILIDGEVVMAPVIRDPIDASALITGDFSRAEAERIVNGIGLR